MLAKGGGLVTSPFACKASSHKKQRLRAAGAISGLPGNPLLASQPPCRYNARLYRTIYRNPMEINPLRNKIADLRERSDALRGYL